jgi:outer membrane protein assembly factor BamE (lipoprotein component of BamABCDE complex)
MKIKQAVLFVLVLFLIIGLTGCASHNSRAKSTSEPQAPSTVVPSTSKFAKLEIGMARPQVQEKIGAPSDFKTIVSGKAWIPFYHGSDRTRTIDYYKNEGRLVYSNGNNRLIDIVYDPNEDGYRD